MNHMKKEGINEDELSVVVHPLVFTSLLTHLSLHNNCTPIYLAKNTAMFKEVELFQGLWMVAVIKEEELRSR